MAPDDVWVGGASSGASILHWDGQDLVFRGGFPSDLGTIWPVASDDVWFASPYDGTVYRWDGEDMVDLTPDYPHPVTAVWGVPGEAVWIGGTGGPIRRWQP